VAVLDQDVAHRGRLVRVGHKHLEDVERLPRIGARQRAHTHARTSNWMLRDSSSSSVIINLRLSGALMYRVIAL
jgi:hypothetical protein